MLRRLQASLARMDSATSEGELATIFDNTAAASTDVRVALADIRAVVGVARANEETFVRLIEGADSLMARLQGGEGTAGMLLSDSALYVEARETVGALRPDLPIVVMAGHADSQAMASAGTPGFAVDVSKQAPMDSRMRDELYWNFKVQDAVVRLGLEEGLNIRGYTPPSLTIRNDNDPRTNWSQAKTLSEQGHYVLEIHFDAYRPYGFGSGLIPAINRPLNRVDEQLGQAFGRFPRFFRGGLGGPRRGIGILEIGMLEPPLETRLRDLSTREQTVNCMARRVVDALKRGVS